MNYLEKRDVLNMLQNITTDTNGNMVLPKKYDYIPQVIRVDNGNIYKNEVQVIDVTPRIVKGLIEYIEREMEN